MRIGELARRTNVPARLLRYYEEQGLLTPGRAANGCRDYDESVIDRVTQIRGLLESGLPIRAVKMILPCLDDPCTIHPADIDPEVIALLEEQRELMDRRIRCLARNRDKLGAYLDAVRARVTSPPDREDREDREDRGDRGGSAGRSGAEAAGRPASGPVAP